MSDESTTATVESVSPETAQEAMPTSDPRYMAKPDDSYTKLAMKNMVRRRGTSLFHFALTLFAVLGFLVGVSVLFH